MNDTGRGAQADREEGAPRRLEWTFVPKKYFPADLARLLDSALAKVERELRGHFPLTAGTAWEWICGQSCTGTPSGAFRDLRAHMVLFPFFAARSGVRQAPPSQLSHLTPDDEFESDLVYSTINGYYYCRLLDDLMDGHEAEATHLAPLLGFFHVNFQAPYARWFSPEHPFWKNFRENWFGMADATCAGMEGKEIDRDRFIQIASRKIAGIEAPLAAACFHRFGISRVRQWSDMFRAFACFSEMQDAMFDWEQDLSLVEPSYLTSEAARRKGPAESTAAWIVREGLQWADENAFGWMREAQELASLLESPELQAFLEFRQEQARVYWRHMEPRLAQLRALALVLENGAEH
jgi:hypothetical protein